MRIWRKSENLKNAYLDTVDVVGSHAGDHDPDVDVMAVAVPPVSIEAKNQRIISFLQISDHAI